MFIKVLTGLPSEITPVINAMSPGLLADIAPVVSPVVAT